MERGARLIVLDTHAWYWWHSAPELLSPSALEAITTSDTIGISAVSVWEVAMLVNRGRIQLDRPTAGWIYSALAVDPRQHEIPVDAAIFLRAAELDNRHRDNDPADLAILASAEIYDAPLVTKDRALRSAAPERTVW